MKKKPRATTEILSRHYCPLLRLKIGKLRMTLALLRLTTWEYALAYQRRVDGRSGAEVDAGKECAPTARLKIFFSSFRAHMTAREQRRVLVRQNAVREVSPKWVGKMSHKLLNQNRRNAEIRVTGRPVCSSQNFSCLSRTWRQKHHLLRVNVKRADWNTWYIDISLFFSCKSMKSGGKVPQKLTKTSSNLICPTKVPQNSHSWYRRYHSV